MKRLLLLLAAIALLAGCKTRTIEGTWKGSVSVASINLPLVITLTKSSDGKYAGNLESPNQAKGVKFTIDTITYQEDKVHFEVKSVMGSFDGKLSQDDTKMEGEWKQGGQSIPLTLTRSEPAASG